MLDLLDANVLIDANRDYYPIERVPEFWEWLADLGECGLTKVPPEIYFTTRWLTRRQRGRICQRPGRCGD